MIYWLLTGWVLAVGFAILCEMRRRQVQDLQSRIVGHMYDIQRLRDLVRCRRGPPLARTVRSTTQRDNLAALMRRYLSMVDSARDLTEIPDYTIPMVAVNANEALAIGVEAVGLLDQLESDRQKESPNG